MLPADLIAKFPKLVADGAEKKSEPTGQYNCIAWAVKRDKKHWWQPMIYTSWDYWPKRWVSDDCSFECFTELFEWFGYEKCVERQLEKGYEKVALYAHIDGFSHVAKQLHSGIWMSKLAQDEDIIHNTLEALEGSFGRGYGDVKQVMKKRRGIRGFILMISFRIRKVMRR